MTPGSVVCSICRASIEAGAPRHRCSVSACNAGRHKLLFCSPACFEKHMPVARHRRATCVDDTQGEPPATLAASS